MKLNVANVLNGCLETCLGCPIGLRDVSRQRSKPPGPRKIRDFRMGRVSGMKISSSQGLKKPPKMSPREEKAYLPRAAGPREVSFFFPRAYFKVFYNPRDEEISIPDINGHSENLFLFEFIYVQNLFFSVKSSCALVTRGEMVISPQARILPGEKLPFPPG